MCSNKYYQEYISEQFPKLEDPAELVDNNGNLDEGAISGNFDVTENNYKVLVYYKNLGSRYDRLIGVGEGSSTKITNWLSIKLLNLY